MTDGFDSEGVCPLQTWALQKVAKLCWGNFALWTNENALISELEQRIKHHRAAVVKRISETFTEFTVPRTVTEQVVDAVIHFQRGHQEVVFLRFTRLRYRLDMSYLLKGGPFSVIHFINPTTGYFHELVWARFFADIDVGVETRFELACYYCLVQRLRALWLTPKCQEVYVLPDPDFKDLRLLRGYFVAFWVYVLGGKYHQIPQMEIDFAEGFNIGGFKKAFRERNEYASRYFWAECSESEKGNLKNKINSVINSGGFTALAKGEFSGFLHFLYSLLNIEEKMNLILYSIENRDYHVWCCLLSSPFYESVLNDMLTLPFPTDNDTYALVIGKFTSSMVEFPLSHHKKIFRVLWKTLTQGQRDRALVLCDTLIDNLIVVEDMDLLEMVVLSFSPDMKECMLVCDGSYSGISAFNRLREISDADATLRYLRLFFVDRHPVTNRWSLREDWADLLEQFYIQSNRDVLLPTGETFVAGPELTEALENVEGTLQVLHDLLDRVVEDIQGED